MEAEKFLNENKIWIGTKIPTMNTPEDYHNLVSLLEEYHQYRLKQTTKENDSNIFSPVEDDVKHFTNILEGNICDIIVDLFWEQQAICEK